MTDCIEAIETEPGFKVISVNGTAVGYIFRESDDTKLYEAEEKLAAWLEASGIPKAADPWIDLKGNLAFWIQAVRTAAKLVREGKRTSA